MKERMPSQEELAPSPVIHKEKKVCSKILITHPTISIMFVIEGIQSCFPQCQSIFSSVIKDFTGSKEKHEPVMEKEDPKESIRELSAIFSHANFPSDADKNDNRTTDEDELELSLGITMPQLTYVQQNINAFGL